MPLAGMLEKLYARRRFGIRPGLDRVRILLERLGNPQDRFRSIHVVGTNGKGSTSAFLSSILLKAGYRTSLFTSPHLVNFNERFRINGLDISTEKLALLLEQVLAQAPEEATFFEIVTAVAALCFSKEHIEIAVIEAGMGGRSDATAALPGMMTVMAPIALDHSEYLGSTIAAIASEKVQIAEPCTPLIVGAQTAEALQVIVAKARDTANQLYHIGQHFSPFWRSDKTLDYRGIHTVLSSVTPGIGGRYQAENAALALAAAEVLSEVGFNIPEAAMVEGVRDAVWPGRMELIPGPPPMLLDGAHNPAGAAALAEALKDYDYRRLLLVTGVMSEKDIAGIFTPLVDKVAQAFAVSPAIERAVESETLADLLCRMGITATPCGSVADGLETARSQARDRDLILICGSLFLVGETKAWLSNQVFQGIRG